MAFGNPTPGPCRAMPVDKYANTLQEADISICSNEMDIDTLEPVARTAAAGASRGTGFPNRLMRLLQALGLCQNSFAAARHEPKNNVQARCMQRTQA